MKRIVLIISALSLMSCGSQMVIPSVATNSVSGTVKFEQKENDIFTKSSLNEYLKKIKRPSIVLRVPTSQSSILEQNTSPALKIYGTIEKELSKAGFLVRDRGLFKKISEDNKITDYSKLKSLTNTDLILEIVEHSSVKYHTNKYTDTKGREKIAPFNIGIAGSKVEFKLINVSDNDIVGSYIFHYTPCTEGCSRVFFSDGKTSPLYSSEKNTPSDTTYEFVEDETDLEKFYQVSTRRLIKELKK